MSYEEFVQVLTEEILKNYPSLTVKEQKVEKLQNQGYNGLIIKEEDSPVGITINIDQYYRRLETSCDIEAVLADAVASVQNLNYPPYVGSVNELKDYANLKGKLIRHLVPVAGNEAMLSTVPHRTVSDLAVVYRFLLGTGAEGEASILLTNDNIKAYEVTPEQLDEDAKICESTHPLKVIPIEAALFGPSEDEIEESGLWVISNDIGRYGASVITYTDAMEKIAEKVGGSFYLVPSSIHEMLAMPEHLVEKSSDLDKMVVAVNNSEVAEEDRLSSHAYHYDAETKLFEFGSEYEARKALEAETA